MSEELKPCPFCGDKVERDGNVVHCYTCCTSNNEEWLDGIVPEAWQDRPIEDQLQARVTDLEKENKRLTGLAIDVLLASSNSILEILNDAEEIMELKAKLNRHKHVAHIKSWKIIDSVLTVDWEIEHA